MNVLLSSLLLLVGVKFGVAVKTSPALPPEWTAAVRRGDMIVAYPDEDMNFDMGLMPSIANGFTGRFTLTYMTVEMCFCIMY